MMKKIISSALLIGFMSFASAQTVKVIESDKEVEKVIRTGLSITLELDSKSVEKLWKKEMKEYGKTNKMGKFTSLPVANIPAVSGTPVSVLTSVASSGKKGTVVWIAIDLGSEWVTKSNSKYSSVEKLLHDFGVKAYVDDINKDIEAAETALGKASKDYDKIQKEGEKLVGSLEQNARQKVNLEKQLSNNASKKIQLEKDIDQNKKDNTTGATKVTEMTKALNVTKAKLNGVK